MAEQKQFDFSTRGSRLAMLDRLELPKLSRTSPATMVAVLRVIEAHARTKATARLFRSTIAAEVGRSSDAVQFAINALVELLVLERKRTGRSSSYRIIWSNLADFDPSIQQQKLNASVSETEPFSIRNRTIQFLQKRPLKRP